tara:strand:- start:603 stop:1301 length:699 start_codon:yes stop_codon:yes gene_type:complete
MKRLLKYIPPKLRFKLLGLKNLISDSRQIHYAQNGEDILVRSMFPAGHQGFYVDVGAHHPYRISNTYLLHKLGWKGINIDPNPDTIKQFNRARPDDINLELGVAGQKSELNYHQFSDPAVNTFSEEEAEKWKGKVWQTYLGARAVPVSPLRDILELHLPTGQEIDLMNIDVEGLDLEVLKSNDWQKFAPKVLIVEAHDFTLENMNTHSIYAFLKLQGYKLAQKAKFSLIFTK